MLYFTELDEETRRAMLLEFETEENNGNPFRGKGLTKEGLLAFPRLMRHAILQGNDETLISTLQKWDYWDYNESYTRNGITRWRKVNLDYVSTRLGQGEFATWYVRGLARKLLEEDVPLCQIYRAAEPKGAPAECSSHENQIVSVQEVYDGHRVHYWPEPGFTNVLSIPFNWNCHHLIRRVTAA